MSGRSGPDIGSILCDQYGRPISSKRNVPEAYRLQQGYSALRGNKNL
jgi:hypothetical protein